MNNLLPENHKRALASSLTLIEKLVDELENELLHSKEKVMTKIIVNEEKIDISPVPPKDTSKIFFIFLFFI